MEQSKNGLLCRNAFGVIKARSVNLTEIVLMFSGTTKMEFNYRRIQRFLHDFSLDFNQLAWFVMAIFGFLNTDYDLVLDRTNWILMLEVV